MIRAGLTTPVMTVLLLAFLVEYLPKICHAVRFLRRMQAQSGYVFGTIWWGIVLNLMAYFVAAHVSPPRSSPPPSSSPRTLMCPVEANFLPGHRVLGQKYKAKLATHAVVRARVSYPERPRQVTTPACDAMIP